jgi:hypothetical protein
MDEIEIPNAASALKNGETTLELINKTSGATIQLSHDLSAREVKVALAGGRLNEIKSKG